MVIGVIPARLNSSRFPKKILADLGGKPMIAYVAEQASKAKKLDKVVIAIDDRETQKVLEEFDYNFVMTSKNHTSGTDRVSEVVKKESEAEIIGPSVEERHFSIWLILFVLSGLSKLYLSTSIASFLSSL